MEGTHRKVGSRPFMPDPTLTCLCSALLGHIAKLGLLPIRNSEEPELLTDPNGTKISALWACSYAPKGLRGFSPGFQPRELSNKRFRPERA